MNLEERRNGLKYFCVQYMLYLIYLRFICALFTRSSIRGALTDVPRNPFM